MFRKFCVFMTLTGLVGGAFAATMPQSVTSEVFDDSYTEEKETVIKEPVQVYQEDNYVEEYTDYEPVVEQAQVVEVPVWPLAGSDADVKIACEGMDCDDETTIVTRVGSDLVIETNINTFGDGWSGGPNIANGTMIPAGFDYECANGAEMPLMRREMMEDDGGTVLTMSRSSRKNCNKRADSYAVFAERAGFKPEKTCNKTDSGKDISVNEYSEYAGEESNGEIQDQVRSWVVADGQTLREVLQSWCDKSGWDLVWTTAREYPIEASAVFKGRFVDVASALVRNFERAIPIPYAKFYKGNRVLVVSTAEE